MFDPAELVDRHDRQAEIHDRDVLGAEIEKLKRDRDFWIMSAEAHAAQATREAAEKRTAINELAKALHRIDVLKRRQSKSA